MAVSYTAVPYQFLKDVSSLPYPDPGDSVLDFVPEGWRDAFLKTCAGIQKAFDELVVSSIYFHFDEVKEKFGALRIYWHINYDCADEFSVDALNETCEALIDDLERETAGLCYGCGAPATRHSSGWVLPYCDACAAKQNEAANARHKTDVPLDAGFPKI